MPDPKYSADTWTSCLSSEKCVGSSSFWLPASVHLVLLFPGNKLAPFWPCCLDPPQPRTHTLLLCLPGWPLLQACPQRPALMICLLDSVVGPLRYGMRDEGWLCFQLCLEGQMASDPSLVASQWTRVRAQEAEYIVSVVARAEGLWLCLGSLATSWAASSGAALSSQPPSGTWCGSIWFPRGHLMGL